MAGGRPRRNFDPKLFESLCGIMCTQQEICNVLDTTDKTLSAWCKREYGTSYSEAYKKFSDKGKMSLRRNQFALSKKSPAMAIFLGKQYLGQKDVVENDEEALKKLDAILDGIRNNS